MRMNYFVQELRIGDYCPYLSCLANSSMTYQMELFGILKTVD